MAILLAANNATTTLAGGIASNATSFNVAAGTGALFPNPTTGQYFAVTLISQSNPLNFEIVYVTTRTTDNFSGVSRGQEGTTPLAFVAGDQAQNFWTAGSMAIMVQATQLQQQFGNYAADTGAANAYVVTLNPPPASLAGLLGSPIRVLITNANTGSSTIAVNGLAATVITNTDGSNLQPNQLPAGHIQELFYNGTTFDIVIPPQWNYGQCRLLFASSTSLALKPYGGRWLTINGTPRPVPQAGVNVSNGGLSATTLYYVYAFMSGSTMTLEAVATTHATDTSTSNYGVEIKSGDATRTLVGMCYTNGSSQFVDSAAIRNVATWFNRFGRSCNGAQVSAGITSLTYVALGSSANCELVCWSDESVMINIGGTAQNSVATAIASLTLAVDGTPLQGSGSTITSPSANQPFAILNVAAAFFAEGHHLLVPYGQVSSGTGNYVVGIAALFRG